ncbi:MAG: cysteine--tRNA ligase [Candidatus Saganbacteria bacterium]|nr:cysteine--tRNA ligase [Candidatus Saganbacteria bacterium]
MSLVIYNTLSRRKEEFIPLNPPNVLMYVCGITPYDETHLGHARAYVAFDVIRRYLEYSGYKVDHVQNITDIDDKIIKKANEQNKSIKEVSEHYTASFFEVMDALKVKRAARYPKATEYIGEMIELISELVAKGVAYKAGGDVFFDINKARDYGRLSGRDIEGMKAGARVDINSDKKGPLDFVLWKAAKEGEPSWDSPFGKGRPGWHTECVVMSKKLLGQPFDIHGGGADLIFPHHENELAQASCLSDRPFVKYWLHNGFITINKEKMSKSLGNFFTVSEVLKKYDPMVIRYFLLRTHYRGPINFSYDDLDEAKAALNGIKNAYQDTIFMLKNTKNDRSEEKFDLKYFKEKFIEAMDDDCNTSAALAVIFEMIKFFHEHKFKLAGEDITNVKYLLEEFNSVLQLGLKENKIEIKEDISALVERRVEARKKNDFVLADKLRVEIEGKGYIIEDTPFGSFVKKKEAAKPEEKEIKQKADPFGFGKKK